VAKVVFAAWIFATWPLPPATWIVVGKGFADCNPAFADYFSAKKANPVVCGRVRTYIYSKHNNLLIA
jgi:hypothetical protein